MSIPEAVSCKNQGGKLHYKPAAAQIAECNRECTPAEFDNMQRVFSFSHKKEKP